jgi:hypothetical protein
VDSSWRDNKKHNMPDTLADRVKGLSEEIRDGNQNIRYDKVLAARMRISNGYYNSGHVLRVVASRLLSEADIA